MGAALVVLALLAVVASGCAPTAPSATRTAPPSAGLSQWEQETLAAAQKEGKLVVYVFWNPTLEQMVS